MSTGVTKAATPTATPTPVAKTPTTKAPAAKPAARSTASSTPKSSPPKKPVDRFEPSSKTEESVRPQMQSLMRELKKSGSTPDEKNESSILFRDPDHVEKEEKAIEDLAAAKDLSHPELQELKREQAERKERYKTEEKAAVAESKLDTATAQKDYKGVQRTNEIESKLQPSRHEAAKYAEELRRDDLAHVKNEGKSNAADHVDAIDKNQERFDRELAGAKGRRDERQRGIQIHRRGVDATYGLEDKPELKGQLDRYLEIDKKLASGGLEYDESYRLDQEKRGLRTRFNQITGRDGDRLANDARFLSGRTASDHVATGKDRKALEQIQSRQKKLESDFQTEYGKKRDIGELVSDYRQAKKETAQTSPQAVAAEGLDRLKTAQTKLDEARAAQSDTEQALEQRDAKYDGTYGERDSAALKRTQERLIASHEREVDRYSNLDSYEVSSGVTSSPQLMRSREGQETSFARDGDTVRFENGALSGLAKADGNGGITMSGTDLVDGRETKFRTSRVPNGEGGWRTASHEQTGRDATHSYEKSTTESVDGVSTVRESKISHDGKDVTRTERVRGDDGSTMNTRFSEDRESTSQTSHRSSPDGTREYTSRHEDKNDSGYLECYSITRPDGSGVKESKSFMENSDNEKTDVDGVTWLWKDSPQTLRDAIGNGATRGTLYEDTTITDKNGKETKIEKQTERWTSYNGKKTLDLVKGKNGAPDQYTYSKKDGDSVTRQTFLKGTEDTSVTREFTDENGFRVTDTEEDFTDTAEQIKDQTDTDVAESGDSIRRTKPDGSFDDISKLAEKHEELGAMFKSDEFKAFREAAGDSKLTLALNDSYQKMTNGEEKESTQFTARAADGSEVVFMSGKDGAVVNYRKAGQHPSEDTSCTYIDRNGNRVEIDDQGDGSLFKAETALDRLRSGEGKAFVATKGIPILSGLKKMKEPGKLSRAMKDMDKVYDTSVGLGVDALSLGVNAFNTASHLQNEEWGKAAKSGADSAVDVGAIAGRAGQGFKGARYVNGAGKLVNSWEAGAKFSRYSKVAAAGKLLGVAGAAYNGVTGVMDIADGEYARGAFGVAGAAGAGLGIWGGAAWAGPVGWGLAIAATAGTATIDYVDGNQIAEPAMTL